jgi:uncharacterized protein
MDITPVVETAIQRVERYGSEGMVINGTLYQEAVALFPTVVTSLGTLATDALERIDTYRLFLKPGACEILLVGTGKTHRFISPAFRRQLRDAYGITLESMDTGAACRTYNVLVEESRPVAALLLPIES